MPIPQEERSLIKEERMRSLSIRILGRGALFGQKSYFIYKRTARRLKKIIAKNNAKRNRILFVSLLHNGCRCPRRAAL